MACFLANEFSTCISCVESLLKIDAEDKKKPLNQVQRMEILTLTAKSYEGLGQYSEAI
jgi:tetratricopeptide (TPR) repeat protein